MPADAVDCGDGEHHCQHGWLCAPKGGERCIMGPELEAKDRAERQQRFRDQRREAYRRQETASGTKYFDCGHKPLAGGAAWDAECLSSSPPRQKSFHGNSTPQVLAGLANSACGSAPATVRRDCVESAKVAILMTRDSTVHAACKTYSGSALSSCAAGIVAQRSVMDYLRDRIANSLRRSDDSSAERAPNGQNGAVRDAQKPAQSRPQAKTELKKPDDNLNCLFVLYRIHRHDLAYSRLDQIPPECRAMPEIKSALADNARERPSFEMSTEDRAWIKKSVDELDKLLKGGALAEQLPPDPDKQVQGKSSR